MYTYGYAMEKQERKCTLAEVHTKMGAMYEITLDQTLLNVLGVTPGDFLIFTVSKEGAVTVRGEKQQLQPAPATSAASQPEGKGILPSEVTQPELFASEVTTIFQNTP